MYNIYKLWSEKSYNNNTQLHFNIYKNHCEIENHIAGLKCYLQIIITNL